MDKEMYYENFIPETGETKYQPFRGIPATIENSQMKHNRKKLPRSVVCYKVLYKDNNGNYYYCGTETILGRRGDIIGQDKMRDGYVEFRGFKSKFHCIRQAPYEGPLNESLKIVLMKVRLFQIRSHGQYTVFEPSPKIYLANKIQILEEVEVPNENWHKIRWPDYDKGEYGDILKSLYNTKGEN